MITDELFSKEFESFHFKEIHRNPPKSLLKPPAGLFAPARPDSEDVQAACGI